MFRSSANARARAVLPVPGGPYSSHPRFHGMPFSRYQSLLFRQSSISLMRSFTRCGKMRLSSALPLLVRRLAELFGRVREQPVVALLVPREAVAAAVPVAVAAAPRRDVVDAEPVLGRGLLVFDRPRHVVPRRAGVAQQLFDVDRAANEDERGVNLHPGVVGVGVGLAAGGLVLNLIGEQEREPAVPQDERAVAEHLVGDEAVAAVALVLPARAVHLVVVAGPLEVGDEERDERLVPRLGGHLDALDQQPGDAPREPLQLAPHAGHEAERRAAREQTERRILHR